VSTKERMSVCRPIAALCLAGAAHLAVACPPPQASREQLQALAVKGWQVADDAARESLALGLLPCLASPDPLLRDEFAFSALSRWMRGKLLSAETMRLIGQRSMAMMQAPDTQGFAQPFAALTLAEVARADRMQSLWPADERRAVVAAAAKSLHETRDYRGFDVSDGWRHAVAHGADLLMQLSLNPVLDRGELDSMLAAVASQVLPSGHFYVYGESERLARPVLFAARRQLHSAQEWNAWAARIADRALPTAGVVTTQGALANVHNAKAFLYVLYATLQEGSDTDLRTRLLPGVAAALLRLP
jgi:Protein of unknown function (DUF2785)